MQRKKVMVFCDYYLPGFKSGGGMWTVVNLVERFRDRYDFFVVTRNHDGKADRTPYESVETGKWNSVGPAQVFYLDDSLLNVGMFFRLVDEIAPDVVFLNSVFSTPSITFLRARKSKRLKVPVIVSPCGELAAAALKLKSAKKRLFLAYSKLVGLYDDVMWRASFESDGEEIRNAIGKNIDLMCAPDLPPKSILPDFDISEKPNKKRGSVRFIFVSRVVRKKNLHYLLQRLGMVSNGEVALDIVGPIEDEVYWRECKIEIDRLPESVKINVVGGLPYEEVLERMKSAHFFVLPTLNENFGYVFIEALACGCPLLISDRTAWNDVVEKKSGWTVSLEDSAAWDKAIARCVEMNEEEYRSMAGAARSYAVEWLASPATENATARLLEKALAK